MKVKKDDLGLQFLYHRKTKVVHNNVCKHIFSNRVISSKHYEYCVLCQRLKANI